MSQEVSGPSRTLSMRAVGMKAARMWALSSSAWPRMYSSSGTRTAASSGWSVRRWLAVVMVFSWDGWMAACACRPAAAHRSHKRGGQSNGG